jgi:hypothetical protein
MRPADDSALSPYVTPVLRPSGLESDSPAFDALGGIAARVGPRARICVLVLMQGVLFDASCPNAGTLSHAALFYDGAAAAEPGAGAGGQGLDRHAVTGQGALHSMCNYSDGIKRLTPMGMTWRNLASFVLSDARCARADYVCLHIAAEAPSNAPRQVLPPLTPLGHEALGTRPDGAGRHGDARVRDVLERDPDALVLRFALEFGSVAAYLYLTHGGCAMGFSISLPDFAWAEACLLDALAGALRARFHKSERTYLLLLS